MTVALVLLSFCPVRQYSVFDRVSRLGAMRMLTFINIDAAVQALDRGLIGVGKR